MKKPQPAIGDHGIVQDERGQDQPKDKRRAQQSGLTRPSKDKGKEPPKTERRAAASRRGHRGLRAAGAVPAQPIESSSVRNAAGTFDGLRLEHHQGHGHSQGDRAEQT